MRPFFRAISANGEEPLCQFVFDFFPVLVVKANKGVLNNVLCLVTVTEYFVGIVQERAFKSVHGVVNPCGLG